MTGVDYAIVGAFLAGMALIGLTISKLIKSPDDIFVAGRQLTPFVLAATIKNQAKDALSVNWATITPKLKGKSGWISFSDGVFASAEGAGSFDTSIEPGDTIGVQYCFHVKSGAELNSFTLQEGDGGRTYVWDLGALKAEY